MLNVTYGLRNDFFLNATAIFAPTHALFLIRAISRGKHSVQLDFARKLIAEVKPKDPHNSLDSKDFPFVMLFT